MRIKEKNFRGDILIIIYPFFKKKILSFILHKPTSPFYNLGNGSIFTLVSLQKADWMTASADPDLMGHCKDREQDQSHRLMEQKPAEMTKLDIILRLHQCTLFY